MSIEILIIDDDQKLIELLTRYLSDFEMKVTGAETPDLGLQLLTAKQPDLIVLDVMLPGKNGFDVCREIRAEYDTPILMLTARGDVTDRIVGLELGADDYLAKPFDPRELVARIQTILRRSDGSSSKRLVFGELVIDPDKLEVRLDGRGLDVSTAEFSVLHLLAANPTKVFTRDQIMQRLKGTDWAAFDRSVDVIVSRLRHKLDDSPKSPKYLKTVWGAGYKFIARRGGKGHG